MLEMDPATMMVTLAQKGGESHTREVSLTAHGDSFQSYSHRTAGPVEDTTGLEVRATLPFMHVCSVCMFFVIVVWE